jgi:hypothetical protein
MGKIKMDKNMKRFGFISGDLLFEKSDNLDNKDINSKSPNNKKEDLKKALEVLNHLVSDIGSDED